MSITEAANGAPRTQGDEEAAMAEKRLLQNLAKTPGSHHCMHIRVQKVSANRKYFSMKLSKHAPFPLNTFDFTAVWKGGTISIHTDTVRWILGNIPSCTTEMKFALDTIISKCWIWVWKRKDRHDSVFPLTSILKLVILKKVWFFKKHSPNTF